MTPRLDSTAMRILVVGAGGVGSAFAPIAARRDFLERVVVADYRRGRARAVVDRWAGDRVRRGAGRRVGRRGGRRAARAEHDATPC